MRYTQLTREGTMSDFRLVESRTQSNSDSHDIGASQIDY